MDTNDLLSSISDILKNPDAKDKLQGVTNMLSSPKKATDNTDSFNEEMMSVISRVMGGMNKPDNRIDLLNSIRPYLKEKRASNIDMAIRLIRFMNIASDFNLKDV